MATEYQTQYDTALILDSAVATRVGQRVTIPNRKITKLGFWLRKYNNPSGNYSYVIRKVSNDDVLVNETVAAASSLTEIVTYVEHTFSSPPTVNEEVRLLVEFSGDSSPDIMTTYYKATTSEKAGEYRCYYQDAAYVDFSANGSDHAYIYTYTGVGGTYPSVITLACANTIAKTSIGYGNLTEFGTTAVTQHGHCWNTSTNPTTSNSKTENGAKPNLGQFQSFITGLTPGTLYYVRAYATNSSGTAYGVNVEITTSSTIGRRYWWVEGKEFHYFDEYGAERKVEGIPDTSGLPWWYGYRF